MAKAAIREIVSSTGTRTVNTKRGMPVKPIMLLNIELGELLEVESGTITALTQRGILHANDKGRYDLQENVRLYARYLRGLKQDAKTAKHLQDQELQFWKTEKVKDAVKRFRMARDRDIALAILTALTSLLAQFREDVGSLPQVTAAIDKLMAGVGSIDIDRVTYAVEGDDDEDEEDEADES